MIIALVCGPIWSGTLPAAISELKRRRVMGPDEAFSMVGSAASSWRVVIEPSSDAPHSVDAADALAPSSIFIKAVAKTMLKAVTNQQHVLLYLQEHHFCRSEARRRLITHTTLLFNSLYKEHYAVGASTAPRTQFIVMIPRYLQSKVPSSVPTLSSPPQWLCGWLYGVFLRQASIYPDAFRSEVELHAAHTDDGDVPSLPATEPAHGSEGWTLAVHLDVPLWRPHAPLLSTGAAQHSNTFRTLCVMDFVNYDLTNPTRGAQLCKVISSVVHGVVDRNVFPVLLISKTSDDMYSPMQSLSGAIKAALDHMGASYAVAEREPSSAQHDHASCFSQVALYSIILDSLRRFIPQQCFEAAKWEWWGLPQEMIHCPLFERHMWLKDADNEDKHIGMKVDKGDDGSVVLDAPLAWQTLWDAPESVGAAPYEVVSCMGSEWRCTYRTHHSNEASAAVVADAAGSSSAVRARVPLLLLSSALRFMPKDLMDSARAEAVVFSCVPQSTVFYRQHSITAAAITVRCDAVACRCEALLARGNILSAHCALCSSSSSAAPPCVHVAALVSHCTDVVLFFRDDKPSSFSLQPQLKEEQPLDEGPRAARIPKPLLLTADGLPAFMLAGSHQKAKRRAPAVKREREEPAGPIVSVQDIALPDDGEGDEGGRDAPLLPQRTRRETPFFCFSRLCRPKVVADHPTLSGAEISKILGAMWKALDDDAKASYKDQCVEYTVKAKPKRAPAPAKKESSANNANRAVSGPPPPPAMPMMGSGQDPLPQGSSEEVAAGEWYIDKDAKKWRCMWDETLPTADDSDTGSDDGGQHPQGDVPRLQTLRFPTHTSHTLSVAQPTVANLLGSRSAVMDDEADRKPKREN